MKFLTTAALLAACVSPAASLPTWRTAWKSWSSVFSREQACNGRTEYCGRKYSEIAFIGAHDSPFVGELPSQNQHWSVEDQLAHGVRFLQGQTHKNIFQSDLELCHTNCFLEDAGLAVNFLKKIKKFLDNNPNEVVTLLLTNGDNLEMDWFDKPFRNSGVKDYVYIPPGAPAVLPIGNWPTLGQLISSNKRLVVFIDYKTNMQQYPYLLDEFAYFFETVFSPTDPNFSDCSVHRPPNSSPDGKMIIVNHNLNLKLFNSDVLVPNVLMIDRTNARTGQGSIGDHVSRCSAIYGRRINSVLIDYVDKGDPWGAERDMNGFA